MINDTVGRASLLPRLSTSRNRVYPCTGYRSAAHTRFLCACTNVRWHPSYQRGAPISLSLVRVLSAPREAFISAYDSSNSASGLTTAKEFKMATLGSIESVSCEWQLSILRFWTFQLDVFRTSRAQWESTWESCSEIPARLSRKIDFSQFDVYLKIVLFMIWIFLSKENNVIR